MQRVQMISIVILVIFACTSLFEGARNALASSQDFQWDAAKLLWERQNPYKISLEGKTAETDAYMPDRLAANQLPSMLILLWPYILFPWPIAKLLWLCSNLIFTLLFIVFSMRLFLPPQQPIIYIIIVCLFVASTSWRNLIGLGQHTIFSLCFFVLALWYCEKGRPNFAGIILAVSLFKYTTILPLLLYFVYLGYYRPLVVASLIHGVMTLFISGWLREWPHTLVFQSLAVSSQLSTAGQLDLFSFFRSTNHVSLLIPVLLACGLLFLSIWVAIYGKPSSSLMALSTFSFVSTVIVYHRSYDYVVLFFPLLLLFYQDLFRPLSRITITYILSLLFAICLLFAWYVDKVVYTFSIKLQSIGLGWIEQDYRFFLASIWYSTILVAIFYLIAPINCIKLWSLSRPKVQA